MSLLSRTLMVLVVGAAPMAHAAFTVNSDGTVTDTTTGLVWDRCVLGRSGPSCAGTESSYDWQGALAQVSVRNTANHLGYNDWRLPNVAELESIVKLDVANPSIDTAAFPSTPAFEMWTSTTSQASPFSAFLVQFANGTSFANVKFNNAPIRLVRGGALLSNFDRLGAASYTAPAPAGSIASGNVTTTLSGGGATCALGGATYQLPSGMPAGAPAGVDFPFGVTNFTTTTCDVGATVTVTLVYPSALPAGAQLYKYGPPAAGQPSSWYFHPATIAGNTITYTLTDGGMGDSNPTPGVITDPAGPGVVAAAGAGVTGVPTLSQWAFMLLAGMIGLTAVRKKRFLS